jgi:hypothetical protein
MRVQRNRPVSVNRFNRQRGLGSPALAALLEWVAQRHRQRRPGRLQGTGSAPEDGPQLQQDLQDAGQVVSR